MSIQERLGPGSLDRALADTFPASDPVALTQPGSIVSMRYAAREHQVRTARRRHADRAAAFLLIGAAVVVTLLVVRRRRSRDAVRQAGFNDRLLERTSYLSRQQQAHRTCEPLRP